MAARRMTQESFDALMQVKAKRLDRSDPIDEALHQFRVHSHPAQRTRYKDEDSSDWRGEAREAPKEDYSVPPYQSEEEDYRTQTFSRNQKYAQAPSRDRDYGRLSSAERELAGPSTRERGYGRLASRERDYGRVSSRETSRLRDADYSSAKLLSGFRSPGLLEEEFGTVRSQDSSLEAGREFAPSLHAGRGLTAKHLLAPQGLVKSKTDVVIPMKKGVQALSSDLLGEPSDPAKKRAFPAHHQLGQRPPSLPLRGTLKYDDPDTMRYARHKEPEDVFTTFGVEIINWAGFHKIKKDPEYTEMYRTLFKVETETCAKMLASFKCPLKMGHQDFCYSIVRTLQHPALQTPKVDGQFLNLLLEKKLVETKSGFFQLIKPFDRYMMHFQACLLKSTVPLLMACNGYELNSKSSNFFSDAGRMADAFKTTASLCRKSLVLIGQTFALASSFRQEKILEAVGLKRVAPLPISFPNFDDSALFGKEYIEHLQDWLEKSGYQMELKKPSAEETKSPQETRPKTPQRADKKVTETIEKMVDGIISGTLKGEERDQLKDNPDYWFLKEEDSLEHKYYKLKLSEMYRLMSAAKEKPKEEKTPELQDLAVMGALLRARKVLHIKKRLFGKRMPRILQRRVARAQRLKRATVGTQTLRPARRMLKQKRLAQSPKAHPAETSLEKAGVCDSATDPEDAPGEGLGAGSSLGLACPFPDVDPKTMVTAERLAKFVAEVGPEIEQFSIDNSTDNPDLWFLHDRESSAFKFYRMKVYELCPSINFSAIPGPASESPAASEGDWENNEEEEEEEEEEEAPQSGMEEEEAQAGSANVGTSSTAGEGQPEGTTSEASAQGPLRGSAFGRKRASSRSLKVGLIPASKRVCLIDEPKVHDPVRIAYDRPRGYQSHKNKWQKSKDLEFSHKRLNQKNIGFQMLQKMGWKEGLGLGTHGKGIKDPVKVGSTSAGEGLGVAGDENKEDTFATFRQRMIQMYYLKRASNK
ncbi:SURP and G-patch domain-containing protein 2 isoform X2 [Zootoca vivipara]|uniref:SURP and G-patch domain-containing protein 2 isoform X2 n=1 Tax=Zootoca vivipara TaxID=8524 RepID=UPI00293C054C|nr:SURP and G-patch domain-containing protein 2 isoform X2 [Zootoca vivipara]